MLEGPLASEDTHVMLDSLMRLGLDLSVDSDASQIFLRGTAGRPPATSSRLWLENSGTSIRFLTALCTLGNGNYYLDGSARMRERPIGDLVAALNALGADVKCEQSNDCPPVVVHGRGLAGGKADVAGSISSQFLSALLMVAPCAQSAVDLRVHGQLVSQPYVEMTRRVMAAFGVTVKSTNDNTYHIEPQGYRATDYTIEPDASAASYFFALAAITGGRITVPGLSRSSLQGDVAFVDVLEQMGCRVEASPDSLTVEGGTLRGVDVDMNAISDTAQTLAAVAPFAEGPTRIRNIAHVRHKETDRIRAVANELSRLGVRVDEHADGLTIHPGPMRPATIETYNDHRMAMSFALVGLMSPGVVISNPDCTRKTYPRFFEDLHALCGGSQ
jgi:3-phosphoshikimate 1-carboxyvinyltransferase